jgi:uncharacterized GH25 family protein
MKKTILAAAFFAALANPAAAYTAFMLPEAFWPDHDSVVVQAAYATHFFTPEVATPGSFQILGPTATAGAVNSVAVDANATTVAFQALAQGTYHISTGEQLGPVTTLVATPEGGWRPLGQGETPAPDMQTTTLQTVTVADAYFTRGAPSRTAVDATIGRLALHPIGDPNQIVQGQGFQVELLFNGQPMANMPVVIYAAGDPDTKLDHYAVTDQSGRATLVFDQPGHYVIAARHRANAPAGSPVQVQSFTTTVTLDVMTARHPETTINQEPERRRRRSSWPYN